MLHVYRTHKAVTMGTAFESINVNGMVDKQQGMETNGDKNRMALALNCSSTKTTTTTTEIDFLLIHS